MKTRLTKSELAVMEDSSVHLLINSLLKKKVVTVAGFKKTTKNYARTFVPVEGKEQFLVGQVIDNKITSDAKKRIYSYIIEKENNPEMIKYVEKLLEERKKELGVKSK